MVERKCFEPFSIHTFYLKFIFYDFYHVSLKKYFQIKIDFQPNDYRVSDQYENILQLWRLQKQSILLMDIGIANRQFACRSDWELGASCATSRYLFVFLLRPSSIDGFDIENWQYKGSVS